MSAGNASVFAAVADPTRRRILARLRSGETLSVNELARDLPMSRQAATKHLDLLRRAGLVSVHWEGRRRLHQLDARPLQAVDAWLAPFAAFWDDALERLERHLEENP